MNVCSHYYAVLALCGILGYSRDAARKIAYSSEFVDEAFTRKIYLKENPEPAYIDANTGAPIMTDKTYDEKRVLDTLVPFHFIPGMKGDSNNDKFRTFTDSPLLEMMLENALEDENVCKLGICLHVLADAWSHQGFSGMISPYNYITHLRTRWFSFRGGTHKLIIFYMIYLKTAFRKLFRPVVPHYSHSLAGYLPDLPTAVWKYEYRRGRRTHYSGWINNKNRYRAAFREIEVLLRRYLIKNAIFKKKKENSALLPEFYKILASKKSKTGIIKTWRKFMVKHRFLKKDDSVLNYNPDEWLMAAFREVEPGAFARKKIRCKGIRQKDPEKNDWHQFFLAQRDLKTMYHRFCRKHRLAFFDIKTPDS